MKGKEKFAEYQANRIIKQTAERIKHNYRNYENLPVGLGLRYVLYHFHGPCPERTAALQALMEGTHLNYRAGLGFKDWRGKDPETVTFFNMQIDHIIVWLLFVAKEQPVAKTKKPYHKA